jgi:O-antigen/teichoic acid export membrane protein
MNTNAQPGTAGTVRGRLIRGFGATALGKRIVCTLLGKRKQDLTTKDGRSSERYRRAALTGISSILAKSISMLTMLVSVPLTLHYLQQERYALWATISSSIAMLCFADLGIGNGLLNAIAESDGKSDSAAAQRYVSSAFYLLSAIGMVIAVVSLACYRLVPWQRLFNVHSDVAIREAGPAAIILILCFAANIPLGIIQRVQAGFQEGFLTNLWMISGSLLGLAGVLLGIKSRAGLPWLVLAMGGGPVIANVLNLLTWIRGRRWLWPHPTMVSSDAAVYLIRTGLLFFVLQLAIAIGFQSDSLVIAQVLGAEKVTQYIIPARIFSITPLLLGMAAMPLWPAFGEALASGDLSWVRRAFFRLLRFSAVVSLAINLPLMVFGRKLIELWVGRSVSPSIWLLIGLGTWGIQSGLAAPLGALLNGCNGIRMQAFCAGLMAVANLLCSIYFTRHIGVAGVIYGTIVTHLVIVLIPCAIYADRLLSTMREIPTTGLAPERAVP